MYTEGQFHEMKENYQLVLGSEEEHALRREIWAVTLSSWIFMVSLYVMFQPWSLLFTAPLSVVSSKALFETGMFLIAGFTIVKRIMSSVFWCCAPTQSTNRCSIRPRALLHRLCHDVLFTFLSFLTILGAVVICAFIEVTFDRDK